MSKKILIVTNGFFPENSPRSFRATELAKELVRQGNTVKVISNYREGTEAFCIENGISFKAMPKLSWRVPTLTGNRLTILGKRVFLRLSSLLFEYPMIQLLPLVKKALKNEEGHDALISIAVPYPIHWGVAAVWSKKKIAKVWIADCGDPYMGQENDTFKVPFYFAYFEKKFCRKANYLTVPTAASIQGYYPEFHSKIKVISQGFRFEDIKLYEGPRDTSKVIFGYGGMFIPGRRDPSEFLNFLNSLDDSYDFEFHIYTNTPQFVAPFVAASNNRIQIKDVLTRDMLMYEMSKMDFLVNFENSGATQTPSKLIDYAILNKPILSVKFGNLKGNIVLEFINRDYSNRMIIADPDQYRIENVAKKFLELIE